jgi:hypothetical protein
MLKSPIYRWALCLAILIPWTANLRAQSTLVLSSGTVAPGGSVTLNLTLSSAFDSQPAGIQWTFIYPAAKVLVWSMAAGPALIASGKSITCAAKDTRYRGAVGYTCLAVGLNANPIADGVVATLVTSLASGAGATLIDLSNTLGASPAGSYISIAATGGTVSPALSASLALRPPL